MGMIHNLIPQSLRNLDPWGTALDWDGDSSMEVPSLGGVYIDNIPPLYVLGKNNASSRSVCNMIMFKKVL